jgi:hypothetical protein
MMRTKLGTTIPGNGRTISGNTGRVQILGIFTALFPRLADFVLLTMAGAAGSRDFVIIMVIKYQGTGT